MKPDAGTAVKRAVFTEGGNNIARLWAVLMARKEPDGGAVSGKKEKGTGDKALPDIGHQSAVAGKRLTMWYVLWTTTGREESTRELIQNRIDPVLFSRIAVPYKRKMLYHAGKGAIVTTILFPSYVFVETDRIEEFVTAVKCLPGFNVVLHTDDFYCPISCQEEYFLTKLMNDRDIIDVSTGYREGERIIVTSGPLKDFEGRIKKVIARRGTAILEMNVFGRSVEVRLGLELLDKKQLTDKR